MSTETELADIGTDEEGYLLDPDDWDETLAVKLAAVEDIELTAAHWQVIRFIREYFDDHQSVPENRTLLKHLRELLGKERATRKYIHSLFPYGYGQQACKIAGMRKPRKLMLDV